MTEIEIFLKLARFAFLVAYKVFQGWIIPAIALPIILGMSQELPFRDRRQIVRELLIFGPLLFAALILTYGVVFALPPGAQRLRLQWGDIGHPTVVSVLFYGAIAAAGIGIWAMRGQRLLAIALVWIQLWFVYWCGFVTSMSVTTDSF